MGSFSASLTTDNAGGVVSQARYAPFGAVRWQSGVMPTSYTFQSQRSEGFGLSDFNARYYDPVLGRFINADTIVPNVKRPQDFNRYSFVRNNPLAFSDPSGHNPIVACLINSQCIQIVEEGIDDLSIALITGGSALYTSLLEPAAEGLAKFYETYGSQPVLGGKSCLSTCLSTQLLQSSKNNPKLANGNDSGTADPRGLDPKNNRNRSNTEESRFDTTHSGIGAYDKALQSAQKNAGKMGQGKVQNMYDPETGTLIGQREIIGGKDVRGWRIDRGHVNWWDWSAGKKGLGGRYGHEFFPDNADIPHSRFINYASWETEP